MKKKKTLLQALLTPLIDQVSLKVSNKLVKQLDQQLPKKTDGSKTYEWDVPIGYNYIDAGRTKKKPEGYVSFDVLRNFSVHYPIARACIDYLKTKINKLNWAIVAEAEETPVDQNNPQVQLLTEFFKHPNGKRSNYRDFVDSILEDYFVIGAIAAEKLRTRGGQFLGELKPVDSSTIRVYIDENSGRLPEPPDFAYAQVIGGRIVANLTQDELVYRVRNRRTNTVYGLSPIESIIIQAKAALQGSLYSLNFFTEGNMPEGFLKAPKDWKADEIKKFERYFNAVLAGNLQEMRRIKVIPGDGDFQPVKKPEDIGYERFEQWILQLTCSVFGVPPQDIGFTYQVNKATSDTQQEMGQERGMRPVAQLLEGVFTDIIQQDFGIAGFEFQFKDLDPVNEKAEAEVEKIRIESGVLSVDEVRSKQGLSPLGLGNYVSGQSVTLVEDLLDPKIRLQPKQPAMQEETKKPDEEATKQEKDNDLLKRQDLLLWRKKAKRCIKKKLPLTKFKSAILDKPTIDEIYTQLALVTSNKMVDNIFQPYLDNTDAIYKELKKISDGLDSKHFSAD